MRAKYLALFNYLREEFLIFDLRALRPRQQF